MVETILTNPLVSETILPFVLVFTLVFAILEKTQILGKEKRQIDAIVALVVGLIFVAFGQATNIIVKMIPILGIALVVILIFMLLLGSLYKPDNFAIPDWLKIVFGILIAILVIVTVLVLTGGADYIVRYVSGGNSTVLINGILILVVVGVVLAVVFSGKKEESGGGGK